jgi:hypothetical protein
MKAAVNHKAHTVQSRKPSPTKRGGGFFISIQCAEFKACPFQFVAPAERQFASKQKKSIFAGENMYNFLER